MSFIDSYLKHNEQFESPGSFWLWSSYATIAGILRDNVYVPYGDNKLYPNVYILFLANSGARKDAPIRLSEKLINAVANTKTISGRASIQGILDELARTETDKTTGKIIKGGSAILFAPELSAGIVSDEAAVSILTDIYDGKTNFKSSLRTAPSFRIDQIVFSALMGSNEAMIKNLFDTRAVHGGLLARTMLVTPNEFRPPNSLWSTPEIEERKKSEIKELQEKLREISNLRGEMQFDIDAREEFDKWYHPFRRVHQKAGDKSGIAGRIQTSIKKMSMIIAANDLTLEIRGKHMKRAIDDSIALLSNYDNFVIGSGKNDIASAGAIVIVDLINSPGYKISKRDIINRHWQDIGNVEAIDKLLSTLEAGGTIEIDVTCPDGLGYKLTKSAIAKMKGSGKSA